MTIQKIPKQKTQQRDYILATPFTFQKQVEMPMAQSPPKICDEEQEIN